MGWDGWPGVAPVLSVRPLFTAGPLTFELPLVSSLRASMGEFTYHFPDDGVRFHQANISGIHTAKFPRA